MNPDVLPPIDAVLNGTAAVLLLVAYAMIRRTNYRVHAYLMISAFIVSSCFLVLYLYHQYLVHVQSGGVTVSLTKGVKPEWVRQVYLWAILLPHSVLAVAMLPMILTTFWFAYKRKWESHKRLAVPTFWVWLYVSVTGVGIYFILYWLFPHFRT